MLDRFQEHLESSGILPPHAALLVGYSGGPDSTCLLHLLHRSGYHVIAAHLHHKQRSEADRESRLCEAFCQDLGVPFVGGKADVPLMSAELGVSLEEAGRLARYEFFESVAKSTRSDLILTAHTRDDQAETVLLNLVRGSGVAGAAGIPERRKNIVRPLLPFTREQTQRYCADHGLWSHDDPANTDPSFSRARIRHHVIPELRKINPEACRALARFAEISREENEFLDGMAAAALERSEIPLNAPFEFLTQGSELAFDLCSLRHLPDVLLKRALRLAAKALGASLDWSETRTVWEAIRANQKGSVTAEKGVVALEWDSEKLHIGSRMEVKPFRFNLTLPGETISEEFGWTLDGEFVVEKAPDPMRVSTDAWFDMEKLKGQLHFRSAKPGDEMQPLGFGGHRKVADLMSESHLTVNARKRLPVVCDMIGPVWVPGVCLTERVRVGSDTTRALHLRFFASEEDGANRNAHKATGVR